MKTYGEAHIAEQHSLALKDGALVQTVHILHKPKPMQRSDAVLYYNTKAYKHWLGVLNKEMPKSIEKNKVWIKIQMFGHPSNAKLLKE